MLRRSPDSPLVLKVCPATGDCIDRTALPAVCPIDRPLLLDPVPVRILFRWDTGGEFVLRPLTMATGELTLVPEAGHSYELVVEDHLQLGVPARGHWSCRVEDATTGEVVAVKEMCWCYVGGHIPAQCPPGD